MKKFTYRSSLFLTLLAVEIGCGLPVWLMLNFSELMAGKLSLHTGLIDAFYISILFFAAAVLFWGTFLIPLLRGFQTKRADKN